MSDGTLATLGFLLVVFALVGALAIVFLVAGAIREMFFAVPEYTADDAVNDAWEEFEP